MEYKYSDWTQIKVTVKTPMLDRTIAIMSMIDENLMIEDYSDFDLKSVYGDLVDDAILNADKTIASVSVFLPADAEREETLSFLRQRFSEESIEATVAVSDINEADWANTWRQYYKPLHISNIVIVPKWEKYEPEDGEIVVVMDPGMAFGTGSHETTKNVIAMLGEHVSDGCSVLDVGCGSGILAICAKKLGAGTTRAYDIDPIAVEVAAQNAADNGCEIECGTSDLLHGVKEDKYDVICANIVADIIIRMAPDVGEFMKSTSTLLCSGIITERAAEVVDALEANGMYIAETREDNGWCAIAAKKLK
ncbi:MAG: 50S ribosomal protein L11 methyltransferase [Clostridia bacterium]|nr:50S ribosomal protein L11 methyltransferase [Clostridia bacterium]